MDIKNDDTKDELYYERCMVELVLYERIRAIGEIENITPQEREKLREEAFAKFLEEAKTEFEGAPKFKTMSIAQLKSLYRQVELKMQELNSSRGW